MTQDEIEARGEFTPRTQGEIDRNLFAARTGGLVNLSGAAFWEMYYSAKAWQRHVEAMRPENQRAIEEMMALDTGGAEAVFAMRKERRDRLTQEEAVLLMTQGAQAVVAHRNQAEAGVTESERILQGARDVTGCKHLRTAPVMGLSDPFGEQTMRCLDCGFEFVLSPLAPQARDTTPSEEA